MKVWDCNSRDLLISFSNHFALNYFAIKIMDSSPSSRIKWQKNQSFVVVIDTFHYEIHEV